MEASDAEESIVVGRFSFSKTGFEKAVAVIRNNRNNDGWLVIDEIGPLELRGEGFSDVVKEVIGQRSGKTILVVREGMADQVAAHFGIGGYTIIKTAAELP